jgi:hypothetical protein
MRTTLDIDEDLLRDLKRIGASRKESMGKTVSRLLRKAIAPQPGSVDQLETWHGFPQLGVSGTAVTPEMVDDWLAEEDDETIGYANGKP